MTVETTFAVSGQHYLFNVQTFAHTVLALGRRRVRLRAARPHYAGRHRRRRRREERLGRAVSDFGHG